MLTLVYNISDIPIELDMAISITGLTEAELRSTGNVEDIDEQLYVDYITQLIPDELW